MFCRNTAPKLDITTISGCLASDVARKLGEGNVVGWFQGRMEFGPRALGNRSILGDARNPEMQKKLNLKIKYREGFRPFAPSVLEEDIANYFDLQSEFSIHADRRARPRRPPKPASSGPPRKASLRTPLLSCVPIFRRSPTSIIPRAFRVSAVKQIPATGNSSINSSSRPVTASSSTPASTSVANRSFVRPTTPIAASCARRWTTSSSAIICSIRKDQPLIARYQRLAQRIQARLIEPKSILMLLRSLNPSRIRPYKGREIAAA